MLQDPNVERVIKNYTEPLQKQISMMQIELEALKQKCNIGAVSGSALPNGWMDWNKLTLDEMVEYLRNKYMFNSSGDAKCIYHLIEFYDNHK